MASSRALVPGTKRSCVVEQSRSHRGPLLFAGSRRVVGKACLLAGSVVRNKVRLACRTKCVFNAGRGLSCGMKSELRAGTKSGVCHGRDTPKNLAIKVRCSPIRKKEWMLSILFECTIRNGSRRCASERSFVVIRAGPSICHELSEEKSAGLH